jgi:putative peptide zinc metalloprotease protein
VTGPSRVTLHPLSTRPAGGSLLIGRVENGDFIAAPPVAGRAVALLAAGHSVAEVGALLRVETGADIDVADFVAALADLGFVAAVDGRPLDQPAQPRPSLPWLRPAHVRWTLSPVTALAVLLIAGFGAALVLLDPALRPGYRDLLWCRSGGAVIAVNTAICWTVIALHELAHLATARAAGVPARMSLSTRLQFLAAQTDVSGVWAAPRRTRLTVYLAGMAVNLVVATGCEAARVATGPGLPHRLLAAAALISLLLLPSQLLIFMRTDVYFTVQDLSGCANLYADGSAYARHLAGRLRGRRRPAEDPSRDLPARERRAVRIYSVLLVIGTATCLAVALTVTVPVTATLLGRAGRTVAGAGTVAGFLDGAAVLTILSGYQLLWLRAWWRRHGHRARQLKHLASRGGR